MVSIIKQHLSNTFVTFDIDTTPVEDDVTPATEEASGNYYSPDDDSDGHIDARVHLNFCAPDR